MLPVDCALPQSGPALCVVVILTGRVNRCARNVVLQVAEIREEVCYPSCPLIINYVAGQVPHSIDSAAVEIGGGKRKRGVPRRHMLNRNGLQDSRPSAMGKAVAMGKGIGAKDKTGRRNGAGRGGRGEREWNK